MNKGVTVDIWNDMRRLGSQWYQDQATAQILLYNVVAHPTPFSVFAQQHPDDAWYYLSYARDLMGVQGRGERGYGEWCQVMWGGMGGCWEGDEEEAGIVPERYVDRNRGKRIGRWRRGRKFVRRWWWAWRNGLVGFTGRVPI